MNISNLIKDISKGVQDNARPKKKIKPQRTIFNKIFSQEAKDERFIKRAEKYEKLNKEVERKKEHDRKLHKKYGFNQ